MITLRNKSTFSLAAASALAIVTLSTATPLFAQTPPSGWTQIGRPIHLQTTGQGSSDLSSSTMAVPRSKSQMLLDLSLTVYKTAAINGYEYYMVTGHQRHAVTGFASNWVSLGYYGKEMALTISAPGAYMTEYGPLSTVGTDTTSWSIGASIGAKTNGETPTPTGGASFSYGKSFSSPNVRFASSGGYDSVTISTKLPADLGDPKEPSKGGYGYDPVAVFQVREGVGLNLSISSVAAWQYEYTRLIVNDRVVKMNVANFSVDFRNKQIVNGSGLCMAVSGNRVLTVACSAGSDTQKWSFTPGGQIQNLATGACLDRDLSSTAMVVNTCDGDSASQRFQVGFDSLGMLPGITAATGQIVKANSNRGGDGVRWEARDALSDLMEYWRLQ